MISNHISQQEKDENETIDTTVLSCLPNDLRIEVKEALKNQSTRNYGNNLIDAYFVGKLIGKDIVTEYKTNVRETKSTKLSFNMLMSEGFIKMCYESEIESRLPGVLRKELLNFTEGVDSNRVDAYIIGGRQLLGNFDNAYANAKIPELLAFERPGYVKTQAIIHPLPGY